jgi:GT2 family glycosyltransferase
MLEALAAQTLPADRFEVVVVPNACADDTAAMVRAYAAPYALRVIEMSEPGMSGARNAGAAVAGGRVLLFMDDDIEARPECLAAHLRAHDGTDDLVAVGPLLQPDVPGRRDLFVERVQHLDASFASWIAGSAPALGWLSSTGGNMSVTAALFARVNGFDRTLIEYGSEDYEFGIRAQDAGARFVFAAEAGAYHYGHENRSVNSYLRRARSVGRNDARITRRHPRIIDAITLGLADRPQTVAGRVGRLLAFDYPRVGDAAAALLLQAGRPLAWLRCKRVWNRLIDCLREYWYFRGAGGEIGDRSAVAAYLSAGRDAAANRDGT